MKKTTEQSSPLKVEVTRGQTTESHHLIDAIIIDDQKRVIASFGQTHSLVFPRSAIKLLQTVLLVESGAYEALKLTHKHLALASSSHYADDIHTELVLTWLKDLGFSHKDLRCGPQAPSRDSVREKLIKQDLRPERYHNNCSGKHSGILSVCKFKHYSTKDYDLYDHPVQKDFVRLLSELYEYDISKAPYGTDGCGIPSICVPLKNLAMAHVNLALRDSGEKIIQSIIEYPDLISGPGNLCSEIVKATNGEVLAKTGAEGLYTAFSVKRNFYLALKVHDGATRASQFSVVNLLKELDFLSEKECAHLDRFYRPKIKNWEGAEVGKIQLAPFVS